MSCKILSLDQNLLDLTLPIIAPTGKNMFKLLIAKRHKNRFIPFNLGFYCYLWKWLIPCRVFLVGFEYLTACWIEAATGGVLWEDLFLEISQNSQENTCARVSFLIKLQAPATLFQRRLWHRCFSMNFAKFLGTPLFTEHLRWLLPSLSFLLWLVALY